MLRVGDLVLLLRQFVNTHSRKGDVGLLLAVRPRESENPMGWTDHTQFTHLVLAGGEMKLYREEDLEELEEPRESANCDSQLHHGKKKKKGL